MVKKDLLSEKKDLFSELGFGLIRKKRGNRAEYFTFAIFVGSTIFVLLLYNIFPNGVG